MQPSYITLSCPNLKVVRAFYEAMGLVASDKSNDKVVFFGLDGLILSLYGVHALAKDAGVPVSADLGTARMTLAHNVRHKEDVQLLLDKAHAAGGRVSVPASDVGWGGQRGTLWTRLGTRGRWFGIPSWSGTRMGARCFSDSLSGVLPKKKRWTGPRFWRCQLQVGRARRRAEN